MASIANYHRGEWSMTTSPLPDDIDIVAEAFEQAGYHERVDYGLPDRDGLTLTVWAGGNQSKARPGYIIDININQTGWCDYIACDDAADLMELLARWLPAVEAGTRIIIGPERDHAAELAKVFQTGPAVAQAIE